MDWLLGLELLQKIFGAEFIRQFLFVIFFIWSIRAHVKKLESSVDGISKGLADLKNIFRDQNKRLGNVEGTVEAIKFQVYELQVDVKDLKRGE